MVTAFTLVFVAVAWFVANSSVSGNNTPVSANGENRFYLATKKDDSQGVYDDKNNLQEALKYFKRIGNETVNGLPAFKLGESTVRDKDETEYIIGGDDVSLMVNSASNVNNTVHNDYIGPGSRGELTFYIIPVIAGKNTVNITLTLTPYGINKQGNISNAQQLKNETVETVSKLLCGHIYLFQGKNKNGDYVNRIEPEVAADGTIQFSFAHTSDWIKKEPIQITLYWIWPYRFENMIYEGQKDSMFQTEGAGSDILTWINANKEKIAYTNVSLVDAGKNMANSDFSKWSNGYNRADQYIGDRVAYFVWTISTDE